MARVRGRAYTHGHAYVHRTYRNHTLTCNIPHIANVECAYIYMWGDPAVAWVCTSLRGSGEACGLPWSGAAKKVLVTQHKAVCIASDSLLYTVLLLGSHDPRTAETCPHVRARRGALPRLEPQQSGPAIAPGQVHHVVVHRRRIIGAGRILTMPIARASSILWCLAAAGGASAPGRSRDAQGHTTTLGAQSCPNGKQAIPREK